MSSFSIIEKVADKVLDWEVLNVFKAQINCRDKAVRDALNDDNLRKKWDDCHYNANEMQRNIKATARRGEASSILTYVLTVLIQYA